MTTYEPPEWAINGGNSNGICMEVIKSGIIIERIDLMKKSYFVAGRMEPLCDIILQHPSVSRTHATLQFDRKGQLFLYDMSSTHGTYLNKKKIPAGEYIKVNVGDVIVFGESTRIHTIVGPAELMPEEYSSKNLDRIRDKLKERRQRIVEKQDEGATWGFGEDAVNESDSDSDDDIKTTTAVTSKSSVKLPDYLRDRQGKDNSPYVSTVTKENVNLSKDSKLFTRLEARIQKMENLKAECSRIRAKQGGGLTDGQEAALDRNEARIRELEEEIETLESQLLAKHTQRTAQREAIEVSTARKKKAYVDSDEEDDFYDRTKKNTTTANTVKKPKVMTMESISADLKVLRNELHAVQAILNTSTKDVENDTNEEDSLEAYMKQSNQQLAAQQRIAAEANIVRLNGLIKEQEALLEIATPALAKVKTIDERVSPLQNDLTKSPLKSTVTSTESSSIESDKCHEPPSPPYVSALIVPTITDDIKPEIQPTEIDPSETIEKPKRIRRRKQVAVETTKIIPTVYDEGVLEGGDVVWEPPKNQTGDGRTTLNDKYGY